MADAPASLRAADPNIFKTATRAAQLQSVKPIIAYWCEYWILKQILAKGLHSSNPDILEYSTQLMDKLEETKRIYSAEEAITDDTAGQAYVEQFAQETLDRAQRVVKANKVTAQTANTFDAAATFFVLVNVWGPPDPETLQKIKYAKWNATRILKAIKDGQDPNESNPKPDELPALEDQPVDGGLSPGETQAAPRPVTIEDVPDQGQSADQQLHPGAQPPHHLRTDSAGVSLPHSPASVASNLHVGPPAPQNGDLSLPDAPPTGPAMSDAAPSPLPPVSPPSAPPSVPSFFPNAAATPDVHSPPVSTPDAYYQPQQPPQQQPPQQHPTYHHQPPAAPSSSMPQPPAFPPTFAPSPQATAAVASPPHPTNPYGGGAPAPAPTSYFSPPAAPVHPAATPSYPYQQSPQPLPPPQQQYSAPATTAAVDDAAMASAQKHAKWAISALNFEDVPTAVRELQKALQELGVR